MYYFSNNLKNCFFYHDYCAVRYIVEGHIDTGAKKIKIKKIKLLIYVNTAFRFSKTLKSIYISKNNNCFFRKKKCAHKLR